MISLVLLAAALADAPAAAPSPLPATLHRESTAAGPEPAWVSLDEALGPDGSIRTELFSQSGRTFLRNAIHEVASPTPPESPLPDCPLGMDVYDRLPETDRDVRLESLARRAAAVYSGTISGASVGFLDGLAGTLLQVVVSDPLKGPPRSSPLYVFYAHANSRRGGLWLCRRDGQYRLRPQVGDRLLFFAMWPALDADRSLFEPAPAHVMLEGVNGELLRDPSPGDGTLPGTFREAVDRVRQTIRQAPQR